MKTFKFLWCSDYEQRDEIVIKFASEEEAKKYCKSLPGSVGAYGYWVYEEVG